MERKEEVGNQDAGDVERVKKRSEEMEGVEGWGGFTGFAREGFPIIF